MLPQPGDLVDAKYRIVRLIGVGGMGSVYEARHEVLGTQVALKFLDPELAETPGLNERFLQEARVSATVQSPHVARVFDVGSYDGDAYLVMELLSGESLADVLAGAGRLSLERSIDIALQVLAGLEIAHGLGVVHRDLKPDNVFITSGSASLVKILDFGIAKLKQSAEFVQVVTRPGTMMGTPSYMAPEQAIAAEMVDARADIYSVGVILYEMLTGARPVDDDELSVIVEQVMMGRAVPITQRDPTLPRALTDLVTSALAPSPEQRPQSAQDFRVALLAFAGDLSPAGRLAALGPDASGLGPASLSAPRPSTVPKTLPPENAGPPPSLVPPSAVGAGAAMPRVGGTGTAPPQWQPLPALHPAAPHAPRRSSSGGAWALLVLALLALGGAGVAVYMLVLAPTPATEPPPLPAAPTLETTSTKLDVPQQRRTPREEPRPRPPAPRTPQGSPPPAAPAPEKQPNAPPIGVPLPTFQIPSVIPLPPGLPTALPPGFPTLPMPSGTQVAPATGAESPGTETPATPSAAPSGSE